jgi:eukaryotic-like serine/threonine-protein kinase
MRCWQCGEQAVPEAHFCAQCGAKLDATAPPDLVGRTIAGRYRLLRLVGEGGIGSVYEAEQVLGSSRRAVAVKILRPEWSHDPVVAARFQREAATVAQLEHFNTVRVYDFGSTEDGTLFIAMEYLKGRSLEQVLSEEGALPAERVERVVSQVAASLEEAHGLGITHRDLKPGNILLLDSYAAERDVIKLVDFGIAKRQHGLERPGATQLTELGALLGTPAYMSPEQFAGAGVGAASDIYSLGVTTYQMLSGQLPFTGQTALDWARAHTEQAPPVLAADHGAGPIPEQMRDAVLRALSKDPAQRQSSAAQFARELSGRSRTDLGRSQPAPTDLGRSATEAAPLSPALAGAPKTAPMLKLPEFGEGPGGAGGVAPTRAMPAAAAPEAWVPGPSGRGSSDSAGLAQTRRPARRLLWVTLVLMGCAAATLIFLGVNGRAPWSTAQVDPGLGPDALVQTPPAPAAGAPELKPEAPEPAAPEAARSAPDPERPPAQSPRSAPKPPATSPAVVPAAPPAPPPVAAPAIPGAAPTAPNPPPGAIPAPTLPTPLPGLPPLPWSAASAGACERCLEELRGAGQYAVVLAGAQSLLCEDRAGRERCERQIVEVAPTVAERAAREGNCPAAWATVAAALNVGAPSDRFRTVDALCLTVPRP